jgi:hypothetical protein
MMSKRSVNRKLDQRAQRAITREHVQLALSQPISRRGEQSKGRLAIRERSTRNSSEQDIQGAMLVVYRVSLVLRGVLDRERVGRNDLSSRNQTQSKLRTTATRASTNEVARRECDNSAAECLSSRQDCAMRTMMIKHTLIGRGADAFSSVIPSTWVANQTGG